MHAKSRHYFYLIPAVFLLGCGFYPISLADGESWVPYTTPTTTGTFRLGLSRDAILSRLGESRFGTYIRRTRSNEYKLDLRYSSDDSTSRLHPTVRLASVDILIDHPLPTKVLLSDIQEAVELCEKGCSLLGVLVDNAGNYEPHIIACVKEPSDDQLQLSDLIGTHWRPAEARERWVPAVILKWKISDAAAKQRPPDWVKQEIETATFTVIRPAVEIRRGTHPDRPRSTIPEQPSVELGTWEPARKD